MLNVSKTIPLAASSAVKEFEERLKKTRIEFSDNICLLAKNCDPPRWFECMSVEIMTNRFGSWFICQLRDDNGVKVLSEGLFDEKGKFTPKKMEETLNWLNVCLSDGRRVMSNIKN